ncbi:MAG: LrgB family protein [Clostridia bacterium]|nr:LrgB family protein [Clostridia bacterium]
MQDFLQQTSYFGFVITIVIYYLSLYIKNKTKLSILNPLLVTTIIIVAILLVFNINYETYNIGAKYISYFLTPTTVCLAIPLYKQIKILKKNVIGILSGILAGIIANATVIVLLTKIFKMNNELGTSLLSKSITAPIAIGLTDELGGISSITVFAVILSGIIGAAIAPTIFKLLHIKDETAQGLACGTSAHGSGTTTALELGEIQGAMSGLAIIVTGLITTIIAPIVNHIFFIV